MLLKLKILENSYELLTGCLEKSVQCTCIRSEVYSVYYNACMDKQIDSKVSNRAIFQRYGEMRQPVWV